MEKVIRNRWYRESEEPFERSKILNHKIHPEGLDVDRIRFLEAGCLIPATSVGHIISVISGNGIFHVANDSRSPFRVGAGVHLYLPPGLESVMNVEPGTELLQVSTASAPQARGKHLLLRDETFLAACASGAQSLRWAFTPQYLSRRIFLNHDPILLSKAGNPVSWFRTTMFDVAGLPENQEGEPVFKMSYNSRTEFNVCCDVKGTTRVRMALHPYRQANQLWGPWLSLDSDSTYHLNEPAGSLEEECCIDEATQALRFFRNKHEVYINDGYVTLFCMFDPAPTGVENHRPGEYSDYEPLSQVLGTEKYATHQREISRYDEMVDQLSLAKATDTLSTFHGTPVWDLYVRGYQAQVNNEAGVSKTLATEGNGRERVLERWMQTNGRLMYGDNN